MGPAPREEGRIKKQKKKEKSPPKQEKSEILDSKKKYR